MTDLRAEERLPGRNAEERAAKALAILAESGSVDGAHHKAWVLDQVVRALTGCPLEEVVCKDYSYLRQGESAAYRRWVADCCAGEDGPDTYSWDVGAPP